MKSNPKPSGQEMVEAVIFPDAGGIPNSHLPLLLHRQAFPPDAPDGLAEAMEERFADNGWAGAWRDGVYTFRHYHSNTHEVLGVFQGRAVLELGGDGGGKFEVSPGDVIIIPAGVSHQLLKSSEDFQVVGAYPDGRDPDLLRGEPDDRPSADCKIADVPLPLADPVQGPQGALRKHWLQ